MAPYKIHYTGDFEEDMSTVMEKSGGKIHIFCEAE